MSDMNLPPPPYSDNMDLPPTYIEQHIGHHLKPDQAPAHQEAPEGPPPEFDEALPNYELPFAPPIDEIASRR